MTKQNSQEKSKLSLDKRALQALQARNIKEKNRVLAMRLLARN